MKTKSFFIYILECSNGCYYTGYTTNIEHRYQEHAAGSVKCKYTRSFPPVRIAASWKLPLNIDRSTALKIENKIKRSSRAEKIDLINNPKLFQQFLCSP